MNHETDGEEDRPRNERRGGERARITGMANIPRMQPAELDRLRVVHPLMPDAAVLGEFEKLLARLLERANHGNFVVAVMGAAPDAGASFVAVNLAATIALDHHRTALLIEGGRANALLDRLLVVPPDHGLADYLADDSLDEEAVIYASRIPRLRVIPFAGQAASVRQLDSPAMQRLIERARTRYSDRFVVLDIARDVGPALRRRIAEWCDFVLLVVPYGGVRLDAVRELADALGRDRLAGVLINRDPG